MNSPIYIGRILSDRDGRDGPDHLVFQVNTVIPTDDLVITVVWVIHVEAVQTTPQTAVLVVSSKHLSRKWTNNNLSG